MATVSTSVGDKAKPGKERGPGWQGAASGEKRFVQQTSRKAPEAWFAGVSSKVQMKTSLRLHLPLVV
jgi:hypothetical protein